MTALQIITIAIALHIYMVAMVVAQGDVVINVEQKKGIDFLYHIHVSNLLFIQFHECLSEGAATCEVVYGWKGCPECTAESVRASDPTSSQEWNNYYECEHVNFGEKPYLNCQRQIQVLVLPGNPSPETYRLPDSSVCFGFVWSSEKEGIKFTSNHLQVEKCGSNCTCPGRNTTPASSSQSIPIAIIIGAAVGVIVIIVTIIVIIVLWRRRRAKAKASGHVDHETSTVKSNGAGVNGKTNDGTSHLHYNTELSGNNSESHIPNNGAIRTNSYQNPRHQPSITKVGVVPAKPQFIIKDNDFDFGYSTAQVEVPENDNRNVNGKKFRDDYDYVSGEDDGGISYQNPKTTKGKTPVASPPKVKEDYAVVDKARINQNPGNNAGLKSDYNVIPEEDFGYSHAEGDASAQGTNDAAVGKARVTVPTDTLSETSDQDFSGYTTVADGNQPNTSNDDPDTKTVYSRLHEPVRDIQNPYNVDPNTNDVYSKLHEEVRDIKNPYNVLPEPQVASDSNNALTDTANSADDTKEQKTPKKSLPYGKEDYAVVVKTKSAKKPTQSSFELGNDEN